MPPLRPALCMLACVALAACESYPGMDPGFGGAVRQNIAAQIIDPGPPALGPALTSGRRAADAVGRYEEGKVKPPHRPSTSEVGLDSAGMEAQ